MFFLPHKKIVEAKRLVDEQRAREEQGQIIAMEQEERKEMRRAQNIAASAIHPDTQEFIPRAMRLSSYAPISIPTLFGFLLSKPTTFNIIFWQWANQTYSAGVNYANRNATSSLSPAGLAAVYCAAVSTSIGVGLGVRKMLEPFSSKFTGAKGLFLNFVISFAAVGTAGCLNLMMMRSKEMKEGISLTDKDGIEYGKSKIIGRKAVVQTGLTRYIMPIPPLLIPTIAFYIMEKKNLVPKNRAAKMAVETLIFFSSLAYAPPLACAMFSQTGRTSVDGLEAEF